MVQKIYLDWKDVEEYVDLISRTYENTDLTGVYGLPRGGLCIAVMISHRLGIPLLGAPIKDCLIVDDICDSGESLLHYYKNSSAMDKPLYHITTMVYKKNDLVTPELTMLTKGDKWIVFPWERREEE